MLTAAGPAEIVSRALMTQEQWDEASAALGELFRAVERIGRAGRYCLCSELERRGDRGLLRGTSYLHLSGH